MLFIKLKRVYSNPHYKKHRINFFPKLRINLKLFNIVYFKFIKLIVKLDFKKEILLHEFIYKLFLLI